MARQASAVAFVLSGGASLCAIQVGMLRALYERGVAPDRIVATSAGAINGAFIATRPQTVETADELAAIWSRVRRGQVFPLNPLTGLLGFLGTRTRLVPGSGLRQLVADHVEQRQLEELPIPLHVVAVVVVTGEELLLSSGPLIDAVIAPVTPARWSVHPRSALGMAVHALRLLHAQPAGRGHRARTFLDGRGTERPPIRIRTHRQLQPEVRTHARAPLSDHATG